MKYLFFVEGHLEKKFLEETCNNPVIIKIPNGEPISLERIADQVASDFRARHSPYPHRVVILLDRERRSIEWQEIKKKLEALLENSGIRNLSIGVCDRKIEDWIIKDSDALGITQEQLNASNCSKEIIKQALEGSYSKSVDGPRLLRLTRPWIISRSSESFSDFYKSIRDIPCYWLDPLKRGESSDINVQDSNASASGGS